MSGTSLPLAKPPLPTERPRFSAGTTIGGRKVGGQYMPDSVISVARAGMVSQEQLDQAQKTIQQQQEQINNAQKELNDQQQQIDQVQRTVQEQQPSRMQRLAGAVSRTIAPVRALGTMGVIRSINRAATTNSSLINYDLMDARRVAEAGAYGGARMGPGGSLGGAERVFFNISRDMSAVRGSLSRIEANVNKIVGDNQPGGGVAPRAAGQEEGRGGIAGIIGSLLGGLGNMFGGGGGGGLGGAIRRLISTVARAIFTKIPIIGPLILVALNIEGAMEEYERNGLGAAITDLLSGIGSDLTFGIVSKDSIKEFINNGIAKVTEWWNTAKDTLQGVVDSVVENVGNFYTNVRERFAETRDAIASRVNTARETITTRLGELGDTLQNVANSVISGITGFFTSIVNNFRQARDRVREASARSEEDRQRALREMNPTAGNPGQAAARGIAASYPLSSREYDEIENMLMNAPPGETPEQRAQRERLSEMQRVAARSSNGNNVNIPPEVQDYINSRRQQQQELQQAREGEAAALFGNEVNNQSQPATQRQSQGSIRPERGTFTQGGLQVQFQATPDGKYVINGTEVDENTYRRFRDISRQRIMDMDENQLAARNQQLFDVLTDVQMGRSSPQGTNTPPLQVPATPDTRAQTMANTVTPPVNVTVNNVAGGGQGAPAAAPSRGGLVDRARTRNAAASQPSHPQRPADVGSAATSGR